MSLEFISEYSFGRMVIENNIYINDIILLGKNIKPKWWRKSGHNLVKEDLEDIIDYEPKLLIIGTGAHNRMKVPLELQKELDFKILSCPTKEAIKRYNKEIKGEIKVAGAFHLTC